MGMHEDEVELDDALVRRLVAAQFPQWAGQPIERVPSIGTVNALYRLGADLCVRLPRVERWAEDLEREIELLPALAPRLPLTIPTPVASGAPDDGYPLVWAVYRWLPGHAWTTDSVRDEREAARDLAGFVRALRTIDAAGAPVSGRTPPLSRRDQVTREAIRASAGIVDARAATRAWETALAAPPWDGVPVWTHGDLLPPNVLVDVGRLASVIDFGIAGVGDPACDAIAGWSLFSKESRAAYRSRLGVDDATWARGRGWALSIALLIIPYYRLTNPGFVEMAIRMVNEVIADR
jgi:aminoglycoside phosphotransferase (APT) family kinase protein